MIIGVPREIKENEYRVGLTPAGVHAFAERGHRVVLQMGAGRGSGIEDAEYLREGAEIVPRAEDIYAEAEMIIKVKEPQEREIALLSEGQILYAYLHLAPDRELTLGLLTKKVIGIAYETMEVNKKLALLEPMSEIAGKMASIMGAYYLSKTYGGKGVLAGGIAGVHSANFLILGGGTAGINAAKVAAGLGARVIVMDIDQERMRYLEDVLPSNCEMIMSNKITIESELPSTDVVIGTVLIPGARTPKLITREMLRTMREGSVIVDVSVDQGGCFATTRPTTHTDPVFIEEGIVHYCVANMPGAYPRSSTYALTNATLPFGLLIADRGWQGAAAENAAVASGINVCKGMVSNRPVAEAHGMVYSSIRDLIEA